MEENDILEILDKITEDRNRKLANSGDNTVCYSKPMYLGKGDLSKKEIFRIIEEYSIGENESKVRELFYAYDEKEGIKEIETSIDPSLVDDEEYKNWQLVMEDIIEGRKKNKEKLRESARELGIKEKEIYGLEEIELYKKIDKKKKDKEKDKEKDDEEKDLEKLEEDLEISEEDTEKMGIIGMNTISLNQKVGVHGETLKSELGLDQDKEYSDVNELEIIPSYKLAYLGAKVPRIPFVAIGKRDNGESVVFSKNVCEPDKTMNNGILSFDKADDGVSKERSNCIIKFKGGKSLSIDQKSPYGIVDTKLLNKNKGELGEEGFVGLDLQNKLEDGTAQQDIESREIVNGYHGEYHSDEITQEAKIHPEEEFEQGEVKNEDADGREGGSHTHINQNDVERAVNEIMDSLKLEREDSRETITKVLLAKIKEQGENGKVNLESAKNEVKEDFGKLVEEQYRGRNSKR